VGRFTGTLKPPDNGGFDLVQRRAFSQSLQEPHGFPHGRLGFAAVGGEEGEEP